MKSCSGVDHNCMSIYSLGDASFMKDILNGVAMIHSSGSFYQAAASALLFGFLIMIFKSLINGALRISFGEIFICWLLYMLMFIPKTTVVVEDLYADRSFVIDNVPIGIAFPGHAISTIGYGFAELMEQGFSTTYQEHGITKEPFLESMYVINRLKDYELLQKVWEGLDVKIGSSSDSKSSWQNYMNDCLMTKYRFVKNTSASKDAKLSVDSLVKSFPSNVYGTVIYRDGMLELSCKEAESVLLKDLSFVTASDFNQALNEFNSSSTLVDQDQLERALSLLTNAASDKLNIVKSALLMPLFDKAATGYFQNADELLVATTVEQAIDQRNTQWALEQSLFMTTVKPFVTFFEAFVYAITPFAAILVCIGSFGISLAIRYLQTLVWLQLWWPILSIINLYITKGATQEISSSLDQIPFDSFYALDRMETIVETWLATAGMLASATPLIAFFLVSGSSYSFTTLTGRMQGADHIDEKILSPNLISQGTMLSNTAGAMKNTNSGRIEQDREAQLSSINVGSELSHNKSSMESQISSEQHALNTTVQRAWDRALSSSDQSTAAKSYSDLVSNSNTKVASQIDSISRDIANTYGLSDDQRSVIASQITQQYLDSNSNKLGIDVKSGAGGSLAGVNLGFSHGNTSTDQAGKGHSSSTMVSQSRTLSDQDGKHYSLGISSSEQQSLQNSITAQTTASSSSAFSNTFTKREQESISNQYQKLQSSQKTLSEAESLSERFSHGFSLNEKDAADAVIGSNRSAAVKEAYQNMSSGEKNIAKGEEGRLLRLGLDRDHAKIGGILFAAANSQDHSMGAMNALNDLAKSLNRSNIGGK